MKILVIDDVPEIIETVALCLKLRWPNCEVVGVGTGQAGLNLVAKESPDLVVLDIGLPDMDGFDVLRALRKSSDVPVIMLTVREGDVNVARFLEAGADDYVTKPFSHVEFLSRVQALLRRSQGGKHAVLQPLQAGDLLVDFAAAEVYLAGKPVPLTPAELAVLEELMANAGRVVTYEDLASAAMHIPKPRENDRGLVRVHVQHLRAKLDDPAERPQYIANIYGTGYKFLPPVGPANPSQFPENRSSMDES
jgi:DNA-binding response OmpR family regulator